MANPINSGTLNIAIEAARNASRVINGYSRKLDRIKIADKGKNEFVSEADQEAERAIIETIHEKFPTHSILAEENGVIAGRQSSDDTSRWIIDPLDGTTNFLHQIPQYSISIALEQDGKLQCAVVYNPVSDELFTAARGQGAFLNNRRLRVSNTTRLEQSLISTGFPFHRNQAHIDEYLASFKAIMLKTIGVRRFGSAALDLAYVAAGRYDGFWEIGLSQWDIAAGALLIQEAGGVISDLQGRDKHFESGNVLAGNIRVHRQMELLLKEHLKDVKY